MAAHLEVGTIFAADKLAAAMGWKVANWANRRRFGRRCRPFDLFGEFGRLNSHDPLCPYRLSLGLYALEAGAMDKTHDSATSGVENPRYLG